MMEQIFLRAELFQIPDIPGLWDRSVLVKAMEAIAEKKEINGPLSPLKGPNVSTPGHQLATHDAAASYARHHYMMHTLNDEPEKADKMLKMYRNHSVKGDALRQQGVEATKQHHEDLAVHYHLNPGHYKESSIPSYSRSGFHMQHAGHPAGTDLSGLADKVVERTQTGFGDPQPRVGKMESPIVHDTGGSQEGTKVARIRKALSELFDLSLKLEPTSKALFIYV